jgi:hypothetical protein
MSMRTYLFTLLVLAGSLSGPLRAQDSSDEFEKGFGAEQGISDLEKSNAEEDRLKIGGTLSLDVYDSVVGARDYLRNLSTLSVYLDARLRNDIRAYAKFRGVVEGASSADEVQVPASNSDVEELKLFFNANKDVFFTFGKQKIKWGSGKFWNPTDVVNASPRDLLYSDDRRSGVSILKTHIPMGDTNFYLVNSFDGADRLSEVGHSARFEIPLSSAEFSFTASKLQGQKAVFGADVSAALSEVDLHAELAYSSRSNSTLYGPLGAYVPEGENVDWVVGASYEMPYADNDSLSFALEYFRNDDGYQKKSDYVWAIASGSYTPYQLARDYALLSIYAPNPGSWSHTTISLLNLVNLSDSSGLAKLGFAFTLMQDLQFEPSLSWHFGDSEGEFRLGDQKYDVAARLSVQF